MSESKSRPQESTPASEFNRYRIWDHNEQRFCHIGYDTRESAVRAASMMNLSSARQKRRYTVRKTKREAVERE